MSTPPVPPLTPSLHFDAARAETYDSQFEPLRALKDTIHLLIRMHFGQLPADARILVVGAGTGAEVRFLAPLFPGWRFTLADPAAAMLEVARRHAEAGGFADRCTFHPGFASSLPREEHHAATSVLVSQFLTTAEERQAFFEEIAGRLLPGGLLFDVDLSADQGDPGFPAAMELWLRMQEHAGMAGARVGFPQVFGKIVGVHGPAEVEAIIARAGFTAPVACFQAAIMRGWLATRR